jgi:hypothetical protein
LFLLRFLNRHIVAIFAAKIYFNFSSGLGVRNA